jgi:hypothetical protein
VERIVKHHHIQLDRTAIALYVGEEDFSHARPVLPAKGMALMGADRPSRRDADA